MLHCAAVRSTLGTPTDPQAPSTYLHCSTSLDVSISNLRRGLRQKGGVKTTKKKKKRKAERRSCGCHVLQRRREAIAQLLESPRSTPATAAQDFSLLFRNCPLLLTTAAEATRPLTARTRGIFPHLNGQRVTPPSCISDVAIKKKKKKVFSRKCHLTPSAKRAQRRRGVKRSFEGRNFCDVS